MTIFWLEAKRKYQESRIVPFWFVKIETKGQVLKFFFMNYVLVKHEIAVKAMNFLSETPKNVPTEAKK